MKLLIDINKENDERVLVYAKEKTSLVSEIEALCVNDSKEINGLLDKDIVKLHITDISCFLSEGNKVFALVKDKKYQINQRLYQIEELYELYVIKINQSCIANIKKIKKFSSSIGGSLLVEFDNGYKDYISRRELKNVKLRMGL